MLWSGSVLRQAILIIVIVAAALALAIPAGSDAYAFGPSWNDSSYIMVGGQNGTWFQDGQAPRLERIDLFNYTTTNLQPAPTEGTVWGGGWNGSQWLISGWGEDDGSAGSNPYIFLYDGQNQVSAGSLNQYQAETSWHGGDIFSASYSGRKWLVSGLGSGVLSSYDDQESNHMSLATFDGYNFTDLSYAVPMQRDAILYANAWNGSDWLVGGGYMSSGTLFSYDGTSRFVDLTSEMAGAVPTFGSVQSLAWNGSYWLIGGENFLAAYDGHNFTDLTSKLDAVLNLNDDCCSSVNAIAWNGAEWMLGGGIPVAQVLSSHEWLASYSAAGFVDLTSEVAPRGTGLNLSSSILTIAATEGSWVIGGYFKNQGSLYMYSASRFTNLSYLVSDFTYVNWVGAGRTPSQYQFTPFNPRGLPDSMVLVGQWKRLILFNLRTKLMHSIETVVSKTFSVARQLPRP